MLRKYMAAIEAALENMEATRFPDAVMQSHIRALRDFIDLFQASEGCVVAATITVECTERGVFDAYTVSQLMPDHHGMTTGLRSLREAAAVAADDLEVRMMVTQLEELKRRGVR